MKLSSSFKYRSIWLGIAMVIIMLYHSAVAFPPRLFPLIRQYGYAGVDIFFFASGIGCYYSLDKDPDVLNFMKRRLKRLAPVYLCFIVPWLIWKNSISPFPFSAMVGNLLGLQSFISWDYHFNWYISALLLFYILMPYLKQLADSLSSAWSHLLVLIVFVVFGFAFWNAQISVMVVFSRLPVLYLGVVYGKLGKTDFLLTKPVLLLHALATAVGCTAVYCQRYLPFEILWYQGLYWYPFLLLAPGACLLLSGLGALLQRIKVLNPVYRLLEIIGTHSFELYLVHLFLFENVIPELRFHYPEIPSGRFWFAAWLAIPPLCILLKKAADLLCLFAKKLTVSR